MLVVNIIYVLLFLSAPAATTTPTATETTANSSRSSSSNSNSNNHNNQIQNKRPRLVAVIWAVVIRAVAGAVISTSQALPWRPSNNSIASQSHRKVTPTVTARADSPN